MKGIEIPFGAKDSELCGWEYTIPEGMEAVVKDGKVIVRRKESEDEKIRKELIEYLTHRAEVTGFIDEDKDCKRWIAYLEKQKEQKPIFKKGDKVIWQDEEFNILDVNGDSYNVGGYILPFYRQNELSLVRQKPAEWSEEDEGMINCIISTLCEESHGGRETNDKMVTWLEKKFKFLRPQSKPTEDELNKKYWEGYKDAMEQHNRNVSFHQDYPTSPSIPRSCYEGGPCTNPHYDCVNCPRQGGGGTYITTPNTVTSDDSNNLEAHWKPSEEQMSALKSTMYDYKDVDWYNTLLTLYNDLKKL